MLDYGNLSTIALSLKDPVSVKERREPKIDNICARAKGQEDEDNLWTLCFAKILTKFISTDNGTSHVINAYLHRPSASFNELKQLHKELGSSHSHKKHKRHTTENGNDSGKVVGNSVESVDINKELSLGHVKFDQFKRQQSGSGNADGENFSQQHKLDFKVSFRGKRQVVLSDTMCPFCCNHEEDVVHLFFNCSKTLPLWWESLSWIGVVTALPQNPRDHFLQHGHQLVGNTKSTRWKCWWVAVTWTIWQQRNKIVFQNQCFNSSKVMDDSLLLLWSWLKSNNKDFTIHFNQWATNLTLVGVRGILNRHIQRQHNILISPKIARQHDFGKILVESGFEKAIVFVLDGCPTSSSTLLHHCFPLCHELKALTSATNQKSSKP
ncbi:hypothetical protein HKD37_01G000746 [Glycine soja]